MINHPGQIDYPPVARNDDPETSHDAAEAVTGSGGRQRLSQRVLECIQQSPGLTAGEIEDATHIKGAWKRVSDLRNLGLIKAGPARTYRPTGRHQLTWFESTPTQGSLF